MWTNLKFALRTLRKSPVFTAVALMSLALGIGANTAIFSFVNAILLKHLPVPQSERLVTFARSFRGAPSSSVWTMTTVEELAKRDPALSGVFGWFAKPVNFSTRDTSQWVIAELVTGQYFETLQVKPALGRLFTDEDVRGATANPVCVLSYGLWQREFAGDHNVIGQSVSLNGHTYRVLGVTERGFFGAQLQRRADLQIPATRVGDFMPAFGGGTGVDWLKTLSWLTPMARLKPGITRIAAQDQTIRLLRQIEIESDKGHAPPHQEDLHLEDGSQGLYGMRAKFGQPVLVLMAVVALVLLVACANLANLLLARAQARAREFALRLSIGASRGNLILQLSMETLLLALCGGVAGLLLSFWVARTLMSFLNAGRSAVSALHISPDADVLAFSIALSFLTAILFGLVPALQATRPELLPSLKQDSAGSGPLRRILLRRALVVTQIAISLVVIFAAGLLTRSLRKLETIDLGFKPDQVIAMNVDPAANGHSSVESSRILDDLLQRTRALPGVSAASLTAKTPGSSMAIALSIQVPGYTPKQADDQVVPFNFVSPAYFQTVGQPLLRGRDFADRDDKNSPRVAVVNEKFVRHYFAGQDPIGRKFHQGGGDIEIAGIVADARDSGARTAPEETVYVPEKQGQTSGMTLLVRTGSDPKEIIPSLLAIVRSVDRRMPVYSVHTLDTEIEAGMSSERILGYLSAMFAALAVLLAGIGLYGVLAYSVTRRTREIGVRFAIGAQRRDVARLFARESLELLLLGLLFGAPLALISVNLLKSLLFGITAGDPLTLLLSVGALLMAAFLAVALPVWRAARVDPTTALRYE